MVIRILVAGIVGTIVSMTMGWLVWGMLLANFFASTLTATAKTVMTTQPRMLPLIAGNIGFGFFYAFVLERWAGARTLVSGAVAGAVMGFSIACIMDLMNDAFTVGMHIGSNTPPMLVDIIAGTVVGAVIGAAEGLVLGMMNKESAASETAA